MSRSEYLPPECWRGMYRVMQRANVNAMRVSVETGMRIDDVLNLRTACLFEGEKGKRKFEYVAKKTGKLGKAEISLGETGKGLSFSVTAPRVVRSLAETPKRMLRR